MALPPSITRLVDLSGRVAIVTGGSRGIGKAIATGYAAAGAKVVVASRKAENCQAVVEEIEAAGGEAMAVPTNIGRHDQIQPLVDATVKRFGAIDIVVNNAATSLGVGWKDLTPEVFDKVFAINAQPAVFLTRAAQPHLERSDQARVINVISVGAYIAADEGTMLYTASKAAVLSITKTLAKLLAPKGIHVNALAPGPFGTDMLGSMGPEALEFMGSMLPVGRVAEPDEILGAALLLAGAGASFMLAGPTVVDGGFLP